MWAPGTRLTLPAQQGQPGILKVERVGTTRDAHTAKMWEGGVQCGRDDAGAGAEERARQPCDTSLLGKERGGGQKRTRPGGAPSSALQRQVTEYFRRRGRKRIHKLVLSIIFTRVNEIH